MLKSVQLQLKNYDEISEGQIKKVRQLKDAKVTLEQNADKNAEEMEINDILSHILGDDGIKKYIVAQYIPTLNMLFSKFMNYFPLNVRLYMDMNAMTISILDLEGNVADFHSFSGGERDMISLVILISFISLNLTKSNDNILFLGLDEVTSSLEGDNILRFVKLLDENFKDYSIILTYHNALTQNTQTELSDYVKAIYEFKNTLEDGIKFKRIGG
jgi:DNA repair exonuclease SbcCD ATPase subunit